MSLRNENFSRNFLSLEVFTIILCFKGILNDGPFTYRIPISIF